MAYYYYIAENVILRSGYRCDACGGYWHDLKRSESDTPLHAHSATTFHVLRNKRTGFYKATSVPVGHERMQGRILRPNTFLIQKLERDDDAYCLCYLCHQMVHDIATDLTNARFTTGDTKNAIPYLLEMVTISFVLNNGQWIS